MTTVAIMAMAITIRMVTDTGITTIIVHYTIKETREDILAISQAHRLMILVEDSIVEEDLTAAVVADMLAAVGEDRICGFEFAAGT